MQDERLVFHEGRAPLYVQRESVGTSAFTTGEYASYGSPLYRQQPIGAPNLDSAGFSRLTVFPNGVFAPDDTQHAALARCVGVSALNRRVEAYALNLKRRAAGIGLPRARSSRSCRSVHTDNEVPALRHGRSWRAVLWE